MEGGGGGLGGVLGHLEPLYADTSERWILRKGISEHCKCINYDYLLKKIWHSLIERLLGVRHLLSPDLRSPEMKRNDDH